MYFADILENLRKRLRNVNLGCYCFIYILDTLTNEICGQQSLHYLPLH